MTTAVKPAAPRRFESSQLLRILDEGYGPGAWHGADFKAALADVDRALAFWRPAAGRHNIAEIALHHAWCVRNVRGQIAGKPPEPFALAGEDWFEAADEKALSWTEIRGLVEAEQSKLVDTIGSGATSSLTDVERFNLVIGITCHAVYHAGQVQLIKRLDAGSDGTVGGMV
jgi:hypothetical protein